jgi:hypothetical protein
MVAFIHDEFIIELSVLDYVDDDASSRSQMALNN